MDALIAHFHVRDKTRHISLCLQSATFLSQMLCINKWCHTGWLNQYICINLQFLTACSRGYLLLPLYLWNFRYKQIIITKAPCFSQVNFSSLSNDNSSCSDCGGGKQPTDNADKAVSAQGYPGWWYCKPQEQSSAPVSSDPQAGMFSRYNLGFPAIPF